MKVLLVDIQYDYGVKARGPNLIGEWGFRRAIASLGHQVETFYYDDYLNGGEPLQVKLLAAGESVRPDLIVFCLFRDQILPETIKKLSAKYTTLNWFGDDTWRFDSFTANYATAFTYCVTTDKFSVERYKKIGVKNVIVSQWAALDTQDKPVHDGTYDHDVSFVGLWHPYRQWFVRELEKRGLKVACFGHGWPGGSLSAEAMNRTFARSKINLNLGNSLSFDLRYLFSHPKAFALAVRALLTGKGKSRSQIKARNFEIPFFGGFQATDYVPGIEDYLAIGREVVCFKDVDEAEVVIRHYLANNQEREAIRQAGQARAREHGYSHRWREILKVVEGRP